MAKYDWVNMPDGERVAMKKDSFGWKVIAPWYNEDGSRNHFNQWTGGKRMIAFLIGILLITAMLYVGISELVSDYKDRAENPCKYVECVNPVAFGDLRNITISDKGTNEEADIRQ